MVQSSICLSICHSISLSSISYAILNVSLVVSQSHVVPKIVKCFKFVKNILFHFLNYLNDGIQRAGRYLRAFISEWPFDPISIFVFKAKSENSVCKTRKSNAPNPKYTVNR